MTTELGIITCRLFRVRVTFKKIDVDESYRSRQYTPSHRNKQDSFDFFKILPSSSLKSFSSVISGPLSPTADTPMSESWTSISSSFYRGIFVSPLWWYLSNYAIIPSLFNSIVFISNSPTCWQLSLRNLTSVFPFFCYTHQILPPHSCSYPLSHQHLATL